MSLQILQEIFEDTDPFDYIKIGGAYVDVYDSCAELVFPHLYKDLSLKQIQLLIWESFYQFLCVASIASTKIPFIIDRKQAVFAIGNPDRFASMANRIRKDILKI